MSILIDYLYCGLKSIDLIVLRYYTLLYLLKRNAEEREKRYNNNDDDDNYNNDDKIDSNIHLRSSNSSSSNSSSNSCSNQKRCYDDYNNDNKDNKDDYNDTGDGDIVHGSSKSINEFDFILNRRDVDDIHNIQLSLPMVINILSPYLDTLLCADIRQCYRDWRNEHNHGGGDNSNGSSSSGSSSSRVVDIETKILLKICVDDHCWKQSWELSTALLQCMIDLSNLSIQLLLHDLSNKMITIIEQIICIQNVLSIYQYSILINHYQLQNSCLIFISNHYQNIQYHHHHHQQQQKDSTMHSLINNHDVINKINNLIIKHSVEIVSKKIFFERLNKIQESISLDDKNDGVVDDDDDDDEDDDEDYHDALNGNDHIDDNVVVVDDDDDFNDEDNDDDWNTVISIPIPLVDPIPITTSTTTTTTTTTTINTTKKRNIDKTGHRIITTYRNIIITNRSVTDHTWHYDEAPTLEGRDDIPNSICLPKYLGKLSYICITSIVTSHHLNSACIIIIIIIITMINIIMITIIHYHHHHHHHAHIIVCTSSDLHSYVLLFIILAISDNYHNHSDDN
jgi:hypothetical protein